MERFIGTLDKKVSTSIPSVGHVVGLDGALERITATSILGRFETPEEAARGPPILSQCNHCDETAKIKNDNKNLLISEGPPAYNKYIIKDPP